MNLKWGFDLRGSFNLKSDESHDSCIVGKSDEGEFYAWFYTQEANTVIFVVFIGVCMVLMCL